MGAVRIDSHQHFWRYRPADYPWIGHGMGVLARDYLPDMLWPQMHAQALGASIAVQARAGRDETAFLLDLARDDGHIAAVVGWEDLGAPELADRIAAWASPKLRGFRHQVQDEADVAAFVEAPAFNRGVAWLQANQREDGLWGEETYSGGGFPRVFYLRYHGYAKFFPLWALARYRNLQRSNTREVAWGM